MSSTHVAVRPEQAHHAQPTVNNFSIQVATINGSGSQTANMVLLRAILLMGVPVSGKNMFPSLKLTNPVWRKPDWAFAEDGLPLPQDPAERLEYGSLGEHALYLADGYMIHGTLYERLLGRSVTHGCIRLGRDDLRTVYKLVPVGTPVFIY